MHTCVYIYIYIYGIWNPSGNAMYVYTSMCLTVCYTVRWDNSRILPGQAVGGRGQKSQWVKRLHGCVSARPLWGCRRMTPQTQQYAEDQPFSRLPGGHTHSRIVNKGAGEILPFSHLPHLWHMGDTGRKLIIWPGRRGVKQVVLWCQI